MKYKNNLCKLRKCCSNENANSVHDYSDKWAFFDGEFDGLMAVSDDITVEENDLIGPHLLNEANALTGGNEAKL